MAAWCLIKQKANKFKEMLISGEISPEKLIKMTSEQRREFFTPEFGAENAKNINALFESKLLLKNQKAGMISWAKKMMKDKPNQVDRTVMKKINKLNEALDEKELNTFLEDLVESKVGFNITEEQFKELSELGQQAQEKKEIALSKLDENGKWESEADKNKYGIDFGAAKVAFDNYYSQLSEVAKGKSWANIKEAYKNRGVIKGTWVGLTTVGNFIADNSRAFKASYDNSFFGRQGRRAASRPATSKAWFRSFTQSFVDGASILKQGKQRGNEILDATKAEIYSRENYLNGNYERGQKLDIGVREEEFPTSFPEKIPALGRLFKISEVAYAAGAMRLRVDIADTFYKIAENDNVNLNDNIEVGAINDQVNIMTGRGSMKMSQEHAELANKAFFSIKFAKSQIQTISKLGTAKTAFARKQAALNLLSLVASSAILMAVWGLLFPDRVEWDSRSANFGKVKIGNVWIDITGGFASYLVLASRIVMYSYKNTYTGITTGLGEGFGSDDGMDLIWNFIENKTSPIASVIKDILKRRTFERDKPTIYNETMDMLTPIIASTGKESYDVRNQISDMLTAIIADGIGMSASSYIYQTNWSQNTSNELEEFKEDVGDKVFKEANKEYNKRVSEMYIELNGDEDYIEMDNDERKNELTKRKKEIKEDLLKEY